MDVPDAPRRSASLSAQLVTSLRDHIAAGRWPVGTRIPAEHDLVEQLGVSRNTLREALRALVHLGLLEARAGDGTYVRASDELEPVLVRRAAAASRDEVFELRAVLEEYAAGLAAARRTDDDVARLRRELGRPEWAGGGADMAAVAAVDSDFHHAVVEAGGNRLLSEVYAYLGSALTATLGSLPLAPDVLAHHALLHVRLVDAIASGDTERARRAAASVVEVTRRAADAVPTADGTAHQPAGAGEDGRA